MKRIAALLLVCWLGPAGCGKKQAPVPASPAPDSVQSESQPAQDESASGAAQAPAPAPPPGSAPPQDQTPQPIGGVVVPFLTSQLRIFIQEKGRLPVSFTEFAGARLDSVPRLQPGLTFAID